MTDTVTIYGFGDNDRSGKVRWTAAELGLTIEEARIGAPGHRKPAYLAINPLGQIPTAEFRGQILVESTAICHTLAEAVDEPRLWVERGDPQREAYLYWLAVFGENFEARLVECAISRAGILGPEYFDLHERALRRKLTVVVNQLPRTGWLCGERFTVADIVAGYSLRLAVQVNLLPREQAGAYFERLVERPAAIESRVFASL